MEKNGISLTTGKKCTSCKESVIVEGFEFIVISKGSNGVLGPGYRAYSESYIKSSYFCYSCGLNFTPTSINKLDDEHVKRYELVKPFFEETCVKTLARDLDIGEVFIILDGKDSKDSSYIPLNKNHTKRLNFKNCFKKGSSVRLDKPKRPSRMDLGLIDSGSLKKPYIVPGDDGAKIVFWAEDYYTQIPLNKDEKQKELRRLKNLLKEIKPKEFNKDLHEKMIKSQISSIPEKTKRMLQKSDPLPQGSIKAIMAIAHTPFAVCEFYIPENAFS